MGILKDLFDIGNGIRSGISDVPGLVKDVLELDMHGVATNGRKVIGDTKDVVSGLAGLGIDIAPAPVKYLGALGKLADSPPLAAAQLVIESQKKLTGSGNPEVGSEYWDSSKMLDKAVSTLIGAEVDTDAWDGAASTKYDETGKEHRRHVSRVSSSDAEIGRILNKEAEQVARTREVLDSTSQALYDYGLATKALLAIPGINVAKMLSADMATASAAIGATTTQMAIMASDSMTNALDIRRESGRYAEAMKDKSGDGDTCDGPFVDAEEDRLDKLPTRLHPGEQYKPRNQPPVYGPPPAPLPVEKDAPRTYDLPADVPRPHITPPSRLPGGLPK